MRGIVIFFRGVLSTFVTMMKVQPNGNTETTHVVLSAADTEASERVVIKGGFTKMSDTGVQAHYTRSFYD